MRNARLVTLMSCQWADMDLDTLCGKAAQMGYDGIELAIWGNHLDPLRAAADDGYVEEIKEIFRRHGLVVKALCAHVPSQCVGDYADPRLNNFAPAELADRPDEIRAWAVETMKAAAIAARKLGAYCVTGFVGSTIWKYMYSFPQTSEEMIERGFQEVRELWLPILDVFRENGIKYCLEVHPAEIAFDYWTTKRLLELMQDRPEFGLNFDPSHLQWQGIAPHVFLEDFIDRVYHVHMKDCAVTLAPRMEFPFVGPRRREFRGNHSRAQRLRLPGTPLRGMGGLGHGPRVRRTRGMPIRQEDRLPGQRHKI